jgi:hypothetical protein
MKPGKSAVLPFFYGSGSEDARHELANLKSVLTCEVTADVSVQLLCVRSYKHMGKRLAATGNMMPEIMARHATCKPVVARLGNKFFKKTSVARESKLMVASSLMLSRELFGAGAWPILTTTEAARSHSNVMGIFRIALSESWSARQNPDGSATMLSDRELIRVHELMTPGTYVRFARLRLSIRVVNKGAVEVLALLVASVSDSRSWLAALSKDLEWLGQCAQSAVFTLREWIEFCRTEPKAARRLVRKVCISKEAREVALSVSSVAREQNTFSCQCGKVLKSKAAYCKHVQFQHGIQPPAAFYAEANGLCRCCLLKFDNRRLLINHLQRGSKLCLLNLLLRVAPLSQESELEERIKSAPVAQAHGKSGVSRSLAVKPALRVSGPLNRLFAIDGNLVPSSHRSHPLGPRPGRKIGDWADQGHDIEFNL